MSLQFEIWFRNIAYPYKASNKISSGCAVIVAEKTVTCEIYWFLFNALLVRNNKDRQVNVQAFVI